MQAASLSGEARLASHLPASLCSQICTKRLYKSYTARREKKTPNNGCLFGSQKHGPVQATTLRFWLLPLAVLTAGNRQDDASCSRGVAYIAWAGPLGYAAHRDRAADADWEGLVVVPRQHVLCQVLAEAVVGVVEAQSLHDDLYLHHHP